MDDKDFETMMRLFSMMGFSIMVSEMVRFRMPRYEPETGEASWYNRVMPIGEEINGWVDNEGGVIIVKMRCEHCGETWEAITRADYCTCPRCRKYPLKGKTQEFLDL